MKHSEHETELKFQPKSEPLEQMLILVDGHCNLCHSITRFVIKRDPRAKFRFASLQSTLGQRLLDEGGLPQDELDTFVMVRDGRFYSRSTGALHVFRHLHRLWPVLYLFIIVPVPIRNWVYDQVAKRRYRWFGRTDECLLPTPDLRSRFVADEEEQ